MNKLTDEQRLNLIRKSILFFFMIGIVLSIKLWISNRDLPLSPVFDSLGSFDFPMDYILMYTMLVLMILASFTKNRYVFIAVIAIFLFLILQDQNRIQPWVYIYLLFLLPFCFRKKESTDTRFMLQYLRILLIGIYFWSGIQKINGQFNEVVFRSILEDLLGLSDPEQIRSLLPFGYAIPLIEAGSALALFFSKTRRIGISLLLLMHVFILFYISPLGINSNSTVYPWNIAMMVFLLLLFYPKNKESFWFQTHLKNPRTIFAMLLVWLLPVLNLFGCWDHYLSFSLFSGKTNKYYLIISKSEIQNLDDRYHRYFSEIKNLKDKKLIDLSAWSFEELNVPLYPESRVFRKIARSFCNLGLNEEKFYFLEIDLSDNLGNYTELRCSELND